MMSLTERIKHIPLENLRSYLRKHGWRHKETHPGIGKFGIRGYEVWYRAKWGYQSVINIPLNSELEELLEWLANKEKRPLLDIIEEIERMGDDKANGREDDDQYRVRVVCDVFRALNTIIQNGGGSFRYLIYDLLGLPETAYGELMDAGGLGLTNWIYEQIERNDKMRKALEMALVGAKHESCRHDDPDPTWHCCEWNDVVQTIEDALSTGKEW